MAQEIRRFTWCDLCAAEDDNANEPADTFAIAVNGLSRVIDLCERHAKGLVEPLREAVKDHGHKEGQPAPVIGRPTGRPGNKAKALDHPCLWCDERFAGAGSIARHLWQAHGFPKIQGHGADTNGIFGKLCPYCGKTCGSPAKFGAHVYRAHDGGHARKMTAAYAQALRMGDPAGVVAKVMALVGPDGQYVGPRKRARRGTATG